ncbi:hypothetical protein KC361_g9 [Hortaea werneckii]|nr:hypothetical protein KC361_g9 [Hortaea werneckii]
MSRRTETRDIACIQTARREPCTCRVVDEDQARRKLAIHHRHGKRRCIQFICAICGEVVSYVNGEGEIAATMEACILAIDEDVHWEGTSKELLVISPTERTWCARENRMFADCMSPGWNDAGYIVLLPMHAASDEPVHPPHKESYTAAS